MKTLPGKYDVASYFSGVFFLSDSEKRSFDLRFLPRALAAWAVCAAALLLSGAVLYASDTAALSSLGYASSCISFLAAMGAGAAATSQGKERRIAKGLLAALSLSALLLLTGFLIGGRLEGSAVLSLLSFTLSGCLLGAVLSAHKKKRTRFRHKIRK